MPIQVGSRVVAPWSEYGDYQEGNVTRLYGKGTLADVKWDQTSNPEVYAGESAGIKVASLKEVSRA